MRRAVSAVVLLLVAGCVSDDRPDDPATSPAPTLQEDRFSLHLATPDALPTDGAVATLVAGQSLRWDLECPCPPLSFGLAQAWDGWIEARASWDGTQTPGFTLQLAGGGQSVEAGRGFDDRLAWLWEPQAGRYTAALDGDGPVQLQVRLGSLVLPSAGPLLPNLVEMVIEGPRIGTCDQVEQSEQGATKCMRFGNGVGNPGHGPVQIRLTVDQGAMAIAPLDGRFVQEVRDADGSIAAHPVGPAQFHASHTHWHYDGLAVFELYDVDPATGLRGALAASHHKAGFCFLDWGEMEEGVARPAEQERAEADCLVPGTTGSWTNGISRGWYDFYWSDLTDQYVDVAGLPDGLYELVASADPLDTLDELDETDNQSSVLLRLAGNEVEVLDERAHYRVQEKDDE